MPLPIFKSSRIRTINRTLRLTILVHKFCGTEFPVLWSGLIEGHKFLCPRLLCATLVKSRICIIEMFQCLILHSILLG